MTTDHQPDEGHEPQASDPGAADDRRRPDDGAADGHQATDPAVESLQAAARQVISATRGLLDAAESLVEDPALLREAIGGLGSLAQEAARMAAEAGRRAAAGTTQRGGPDGDDGPDDEGPVQHIPVG